MRLSEWYSLFSILLLFAVPHPSLASPTPKMLAEIAEFTGVAASPDGRFVAFRVHRGSVEHNSYSSDWYVAPVSGDEPPVRIADGGEPLRLGGYPTTVLPQWSADSNEIYFRALHEGAVQIWRARRDGKRALPVTDDAANIIRFQLIGGDRLVYEVGATRKEIADAEMHEFDQGILIDADVPVGRPLFRSHYIEGRLASDRYTGQWLLTGSLLADGERRYKTADLRQRRTRTASNDEVAAFHRAREGGNPSLAASTRPQGFEVSGRRIAFVSTDGAELRARPDGESGSEVVCKDPACASVSWFAWAPQQDEIVFASRDRARSGAQTLYEWDVAANAVRRVLATDGALHGGEYFDPASRCAITYLFAVCVAVEANAPPRLERINLASGERNSLFEPNRDLAAASGPPAELLEWRSDDGFAFSGRFLPAAGVAPGEKAPLFITYYDCSSYLRGGVGDEWPLATLAASGIAILCIHQTSLDAGATAIERYRAALAGIEAAIDILAERGVDRMRVAMGGFSFGSEVVMWTAMNSDLLAAASLASPSLSETYFWQRAHLGDFFEKGLTRSWRLGQPSETLEQWRAVAAQHNLDKIADIPILMQFPEEEYLAAIDYFAPLKRRGAPVEMHVFPHEPHYKFLPRHKLAVYERNLDWLRFWLQDYVDPAFDKAGQYDRWRALQSESAHSGRAPN